MLGINFFLYIEHALTRFEPANSRRESKVAFVFPAVLEYNLSSTSLFF